MARDSKYAGGGWTRAGLIGSAFFLTVFGLLMIYSASSITASVDEGSSIHYVLRQAMFIGLGGIGAFFLSRMDYRILRPLAQKIWVGAVIMLVLTLFVGVKVGGARRWLPMGLFNLQPSELAKIACVLIISALAVEWRRGRMGTGVFLRQTAIYSIIPAALVVLQPDLGTTVTLAVGVVFVLWLAGINATWVIGSGGLMVISAVGLILSSDYRRSRFFAFFNPWEDRTGTGYQIVQALLAFGTGGINGVGLGLSRQKFFYLPEAHNDFILAIIGEEFGLWGSLVVVGFLIVFVICGFRIATGAKDEFGRLVAGSITGMLAVQAILNMAAVTGVMPITGKPLPFVSYGGSSMLVTMISLGLLLSVSSFGGMAPRAVRSRRDPEEGNVARVHERRRNGGSRVPGAGRRPTSRKRA